MAPRLAIGAGRGRLIRQLLVESLLIAVLGGGLGLMLAQFGVAAFAGIDIPSEIPVKLDVRIDPDVLWRAVYDDCELVNVRTGAGICKLANRIQRRR